jgi:hypothetical protein
VGHLRDPTVPLSPPAEGFRLATIPETRFVRSGGVDLAYQIFGSGPRDVLAIAGWISHLEAMWELPEFARFLDRLGTMGRIVMFDKRGTRVSDPVKDLVPGSGLELDDRGERDLKGVPGTWHLWALGGAR